MPNPGLPMRFF